MKPDIGPMLEVYADGDFSGNWNKNTAEYDVSTAKSGSETKSLVPASYKVPFVTALVGPL